MDKVFIEKEVRKFLQEVVSFIQGYEPDFTCSCNVDWSLKRSTSRGGMYRNGPGINLALAGETPRKFPATYTEYVSFTEDSVIGGFTYDEKHPLLGLKALVCHEVAHAVMAYKNLSATGHGNEWKSIYRVLRNLFVNQYLDNIKLQEIEPLDKILLDLVDKDIRIFDEHCYNYGLKPKHYGKEFVYKAEKHRICGINPRARKYPIKTERIHDNKVFWFEHQVVVKGLQ